MEHKKTMLDYIADCPEFIRNNVADSAALTKPLVDEYVNGGYKNIWIVACGSSSNGSLCARQFIRRHLKCEVKIVTPFHFVSSENDFGETDMVVVVSQSGYSLNALDAIKVIEAKGRRCIGLTGDFNSDLGKVCDVVANYGVGRETVAYVTRGVTTLALFFMLFAVEAAVRLGIKTAAEGEAVKQQLLKAADINAAVQAQTPSFIKEHYRQLSGMTNAYVCGVGANLGTASEGALKFGETVSIPTAVYEVEEYIHGPNIQMTPRYSVFLIDGGEGTERIHRIFEGTQIVTDNVFLLTRCADYKDEHNVLYVPMDVPEEITPLCWLPFFQMTACQLTNDLDRWKEKFTTIYALDTDRKDGWETGFVTEFVSRIPFKDFGEDYSVVVVGPPPMMKFTGLEVLKQGVPEEKIWMSFERKMSCAVGKCGHCRIDEVYVCLDGPVFNYTQAKYLVD